MMEESEESRVMEGRGERSERRGGTERNASSKGRQSQVSVVYGAPGQVPH